jgi:hypothetical protein
MLSLHLPLVIIGVDSFFIVLIGFVRAGMAVYFARKLTLNQTLSMSADRNILRLSRLLRVSKSIKNIAKHVAQKFGVTGFQRVLLCRNSARVIAGGQTEQQWLSESLQVCGGTCIEGWEHSDHCDASNCECGKAGKHG